MNPTILLVEDDRWVGDCYAGWLKSFGCTVHLATDAQVALDILDDTKVDVIMLDLLLPFANGLQLLNVLASHADLMAVPVIVCSSLTLDQPLAHLGVCAVLNKSTLTPQQLRATVQKAVSSATI